ncbi:MAG TPA: hypothetical protein PKW15_05890, partial [Alphaproteobacteria bacterium]|nr:hypothetical protein [Alphaproteobacteria bacterium]
MLQKLSSISGFLRQNWVIAVLLMICFVPWFVTRISMLYQYQTPPNQTIHPNYYTFHEMSQSWDEGQKLGVINVSRMVINMQRIMLNGYTREKSPDDKYCTYLSLDPGYAVIVSVARKLFPTLPDSYLRAGAMQMIFDGIMLFAIFVTFLRMGPIPATVAGIIYGIHPVFSYQAIFPFQYFWEGWLFGASVIALLWARRFSLGNRPIATLALVILIALMTGFSLWVRSTALVAAVAIILTFMCVPSLRRYFGIFILIFTLTVLPQAVRASSVQGHFALSTRMSWHTAYHALGRYPNKYGIEDEDLYAFDTTQNDYGVSYNYCDYSKHDIAAKQAYMKIWEDNPEFVIRSIITRITTNILYNYNFELESYNGMILFLLGVSAFIFALLRRGEYLFVTGLTGFVYLGYNVAVGLFYYIAPPYAYITQLALLFCIPVFMVAVLMGLGKLFRQDNEPGLPGPAPLAKVILGIVLLSVIGAGAALSLPQVRNYIFQKKPNQYLWISYNEPNREDNQKMVEDWKKLPENLQKQYLEMVYQSVPKTAPRPPPVTASPHRCRAPWSRWRSPRA